MNEKTKKTKEWYLKGTPCKVNVGDKFTWSQEITFEKYPDTVLKTTIDDVIDMESLQTLVEADILEEKVVTHTTYLDYLKTFAERKNVEYADLVAIIGSLMQVDPTAALIIVLKAISMVHLDHYKSYSVPQKVWIYNTTTCKPAILDVTDEVLLDNVAYFITKTALMDALDLCKPILSRM